MAVVNVVLRDEAVEQVLTNHEDLIIVVEFQNSGAAEVWQGEDKLTRIEG